MADILASRNHLVLARFARSNLLVAFDYDGTLAPIVQAPDRARMRPTTRRLLRSVTERYPCMVISGRARADLIRRLGDLPVEHVSGNHGLEPWGENERYVQQAREWVAYLTPRLRNPRDRPCPGAAAVVAHVSGRPLGHDRRRGLLHNGGVDRARAGHVLHGLRN